MVLPSNKIVESQNNIDSENIVDNQDTVECIHNEDILSNKNIYNNEMRFTPLLQRESYNNNNDTEIIIMFHLQEKNLPLSSCMESTVVSQNSLNNTAIVETKNDISTINLFTPKGSNSDLHNEMMYTDIHNTEPYHKERNEINISSYVNTEQKISKISYSDL